jgi:hypothetical protein
VAPGAGPEFKKNKKGEKETYQMLENLPVLTLVVVTGAMHFTVHELEMPALKKKKTVKTARHGSMCL